MQWRSGIGRLAVLSLVAGVVGAGMVFPVVGGIGLAAGAVGSSGATVSEDLRSGLQPAVTTITDSTGAPLAYLYDQFRIPVANDRIAPAMKAAAVAIEDRRFYDHGGVDPIGTARGAGERRERRRAAGRLDDHAAVRQELRAVRGRDDGRAAPRGGRAEHRPQGHRGGAGGAARQRAAQGRDPRPLPRRRVLRPRRVRRGCRGEGVLRHDGRRADRRAVGAARRHGAEPHGVRPHRTSRRRQGAARHGDRGDGPAGPIDAPQAATATAAPLGTVRSRPHRRRAAPGRATPATSASTSRRYLEAAGLPADKRGAAGTRSGPPSTAPRSAISRPRSTPPIRRTTRTSRT